MGRISEVSSFSSRQSDVIAEVLIKYKIKYCLQDWQGRPCRKNYLTFSSNYFFVTWIWTCAWVRYYYWCISSVDGLGTQTETSKFVLKVFISSRPVKPWTKELLQNCTFPCFLLLSVLGTWDCYWVWVTLRWTKCRSTYDLVTSLCNCLKLLLLESVLIAVQIIYASGWLCI